ncbi:hypothetical protein HX859_12830 [Pseudomonas gingeri]|uniref:hypothetical protein n=1 Tax=Pseudomonas gingeri TaxID=117681 RepID=UPI0015A2CDAA|nr:hypothetical protein [Pseudomonas gingeri]NVZ75770.1 hypothetical protein [Pseudomonas gingeri]
MPAKASAQSLQDHKSDASLKALFVGKPTPTGGGRISAAEPVIVGAGLPAKASSQSLQDHKSDASLKALFVGLPAKAFSQSLQDHKSDASLKALFVGKPTPTGVCLIVPTLRVGTPLRTLCVRCGPVTRNVGMIVITRTHAAGILLALCSCSNHFIRKSVSSGDTDGVEPWLFHVVITS